MTSVTIKKTQKRIRRLTAKAIIDHKMIEENDKVMICLSGGKDSFTMLNILIDLKKIAPIKFDLVAVNLDQKQPGFDETILPRYFTENNIPFHIIEEDTYSIVKEKIPEGKTKCSLCSRLRRGAIYNFAHKEGFNKIALGHHKQDILETFFLNLFFGGKLKSMPPKLTSDDKRNVVIRPLSYVDESDIIRYAKYKDFPIIPCNLCGTQKNLQRQQIKDMIKDWEKSFPNRTNTMFTALQNIVPTHLLDKNLISSDSD